MSTVTDDSVTTATQVYRVYIKATAEAIWQAITDPEWSQRYGYGGYVHYDLRPGGALTVNPSEEMRAASAAMGYEIPDVIIDGEVIEADPPHKLVTTWRMLMDAGTAAEGFTRITYEIKSLDAGYCSLTLVHELDGAPVLAALVSGAQEEFGAGGGHPWVLSDLKSLLETGAGLAG
ncbi:MAG TPA: SRPBCC domain-containing protein [Acidimicrobiales bacterium]|nr:SRPBCC domain-containing protein [Acidimicrobiales bacterium]